MRRLRWLRYTVPAATVPPASTSTPINALRVTQAESTQQADAVVCFTRSSDTPACWLTLSSHAHTPTHLLSQLLAPLLTHSLAHSSAQYGVHLLTARSHARFPEPPLFVLACSPATVGPHARTLSRARSLFVLACSLIAAVSHSLARSRTHLLTHSLIHRLQWHVPTRVIFHCSTQPLTR